MPTAAKPAPSARTHERLKKSLAALSSDNRHLAAREQDLRLRIRELESICDDWDDRFQRLCFDIRGRYAAIGEIRALLKRRPPDIAEALKIIAEELD